MHASTATFLAGGSGRLPLSKLAAWVSAFCSSSSVALMVVVSGDGGQGSQLLVLGQGMTLERPARLDQVRAHPTQRGRVGVERSSWRGAGVHHPVDVDGREVEDVARRI